MKTKAIALLVLFHFFHAGLMAQEKKPNDTSFEWYDMSLPMEDRIDALISAMTVDEKISQLMNANAPIPRLGVKEYDWWNECLHGVARNGRATVFPQAIALGATFDTKLAFQVATAISDEARAKFNIAQKMGNYHRYAGLTFWTPNVNIFRDPRWGRGQETYGEDPFLTSRIGVAFVEGLQGNNPKYLKAAACAKHFAVHSGPEALRHQFDAVVSSKDLWETYLPAFEALVKEAKVEAVMGAYNRTDGQACCASPFLLQDILTKQWGFKGHIVSDCGAIQDIWKDHHLAKTPAEASSMAIKAAWI
ncbi:glycoside hydrolase family 3 protein [Prolixibacter bellariivorans]|uniref:glycoside hydrolase family 3 protein n=1 Tax=Prolixibacter bellariivorans TaxID=314319 RepID=UPI000AA32A70|nr:glycoside hydrolase family 3 N-terminal domain-containing protein [Prolixibacter bellariivorans]